MGSSFVLVDGLLGKLPDPRPRRFAWSCVDWRKVASSASGRATHPRVLNSDLKDNSQSLYDHLQMLAPKNETQAAVKGAAISAAINLRHTYWLMFLGTEQSSLSLPLLAVVVLWLTFIFTSFGLFAPRTKTIFVTLLACALAVSGAIFIIMAMYTPFSGVMKISSAPIRNALSVMGH